MLLTFLSSSRGGDALTVSKFPYLSWDIITIYICLPICWLNQTSHYFDRRRFSCTVVAKKSKNLAFIHSDVQTVDCFEAIAVLFEKINYFYEAPLFFKL